MVCISPPCLLLLEVFSAADRNHRARDSSICGQNALTLAYVHLSVQKFSGVIPRTPVLKGREGRQKGSRVGLKGLEGRERKGKKDMKGGEGGRGWRGKGRRIVKAGAP
jgi:hypothetical protein